MNTNRTPFRSIAFPIAVDSSLGRLDEENDYAAHVDQMMRQLLRTSPGERINMPDFGCGLMRLVFAPNSVLSASLAQVAIFDALQRWMDPVITVSDVKAVAIEERLEISIAYILKARQQRRYLNLEVTL